MRPTESMNFFTLGKKDRRPYLSCIPYSFNVCAISGARLCTKSHEVTLLCATSVFSVSLWLMNSEQKQTTETQRTQRLHREIQNKDFLCKALEHGGRAPHSKERFVDWFLASIAK